MLVGRSRKEIEVIIMYEKGLEMLFLALVYQGQVYKPIRNLPTAQTLYRPMLGPVESWWR